MHHFKKNNQQKLKIIVFIHNIYKHMFAKFSATEFDTVIMSPRLIWAVITAPPITVEESSACIVGNVKFLHLHGVEIEIKVYRIWGQDKQTPANKAPESNVAIWFLPIGNVVATLLSGALSPGIPSDTAFLSR